MKKSAFTMIELIFVIVILGILAAVAIPRLSGTRDDAKVVTEVTNAAQGLQNLAAEYTAKSAFIDYNVTEANKVLNCFTFTLNSAVDGNISLAVITVATPTCSTQVLPAVTTIAKNNGLINSDGSLRTYVFSATGIIN